LRKLGIDLGQVRIGLSLSDPLGIIASSLETYKRQNLQTDLNFIAKLVDENEVDMIVIGLPINMDGTKGIKCQETYDFCEALSKIVSVKIEYQDERLTTVSAQKALIEADIKRKDRRQIVDKVAASIILQNYLDKKRRL